MSDNTLIERRVKRIFIQYKMDIAMIAGKEKSKDEVIFLKEPDDKEIESMFTINKVLTDSRRCTSKEEVMVCIVNFVLTLFNHSDRKFLLQEFYFNNNNYWYENQISRSSYYRIKIKLAAKFNEYYEALDPDLNYVTIRTI